MCRSWESLTKPSAICIQAIPGCSTLFITDEVQLQSQVVTKAVYSVIIGLNCKYKLAQQAAVSHQMISLVLAKILKNPSGR